MRNVSGWILVLLLLLPLAGRAGENLIDNPSFELTKERDQFGFVMVGWGGWKYEGDCSFEIGQVAHTGNTSCLLQGGAGAKIRVAQNHDLHPGRYRITAYLRGLDIGTGMWDMTTEFMFNGNYMQLHKNGTFGWTKLNYVAEVKEAVNAGPSFGLMAPGYFWIDDVSMELVGEDVPLTPQPVLGAEEAPIEPPGELAPGWVRCPECGYRNMPAWHKCYACGCALAAKAVTPAGPKIKPVTSFEEAKNPFDSGTLVEAHATDGNKALRIDRSYACMDGHFDWSGYDYLKADLYTDSPDPMQLYIEIRDGQTRDYWTRVNYMTVIPPGQSTLILPLKQLYVGEKSRPGRMLLTNDITRFVFNIGDQPAAPLFVDNMRLEREESGERVHFDGLYAFSFGPATSPLMDGFTPHHPRHALQQRARLRPERRPCLARLRRAATRPALPGFHLHRIRRAGGRRAQRQVPCIREYRQPFRLLGGVPGLPRARHPGAGQESRGRSHGLRSCKQHYFRLLGHEDLPSENTFDSYQKTLLPGEGVRRGGEQRAVAAGIPGGELGVQRIRGDHLPGGEGGGRQRASCEYVEDRRRFYFDNYFKRMLHRPSRRPAAACRPRTSSAAMCSSPRFHARPLLQRYPACRRDRPAVARGRLRRAAAVAVAGGAAAARAGRRRPSPSAS